MNLTCESNGSQPPESPGTAVPALSPAVNEQREHIRLYVLAALTVGLICLCVLLAIPFLSAITWGVALAIMAWPLHRWISQRIERPVPSALISTAAVVLVILVPGIFVSYQLAREAAAVAVQAEKEPGTSSIREKMAEWPALEELGLWLDKMDVQIEAEGRKLIGAYTQDAASVAQGSFAAIIQFLVAVFILYYLFLDRGTFLHGLRGILPLSRDESDKVFARAAASVHANLYAVTITSAIDATGFGLLFWVFGLPAPLLWGVVMFILALLPVLGATLVWLPVVAYLMLTDRVLPGAAILGWGLVTFICVDNILYCRLVGQGTRMHEVLTLIAFLGGLAVFGLSGVILGPAILAVTIAFLGVWRQRMTSETMDPVAAEAASAPLRT